MCALQFAIGQANQRALFPFEHNDVANMIDVLNETIEHAHRVGGAEPGDADNLRDLHELCTKLSGFLAHGGSIDAGTPLCKELSDIAYCLRLECNACRAEGARPANSVLRCLCRRLEDVLTKHGFLDDDPGSVTDDPEVGHTACCPGLVVLQLQRAFEETQQADVPEQIVNQLRSAVDTARRFEITLARAKAAIWLVPTAVRSERDRCHAGHHRRLGNCRTADTCGLITELEEIRVRLRTVCVQARTSLIALEKVLRLSPGDGVSINTHVIAHEMPLRMHLDACEQLAKVVLKYVPDLSA